MSETSARERFTAAMRWLKDRADDDEMARQAVEAFADAVCSGGGDEATCRLATDGTEAEHAACRAALLKACGL